MTQEEKQLLLKDLCARLPYGLIVSYTEFEYGIKSKHTFSNLEVWNDEVRDGTALVVCDRGYHKYYIEEIQPYLRPMSSMTEEERGQYMEFIEWSHNDYDGTTTTCIIKEKLHEYLDFIYSHHFDDNGLIEKGLALEAPEGMYNIK